MYLFAFLLILSILYFIFGWKHDSYGKYKHESCFYKNWTIFNLCQKKNYIILNFNYPMINTFLVIFLNQKVGSILNPIRKVSLSILPTTF
jgi:hypothetical protein